MIDTAILFRSGELEGDHTLAWRDLEGEAGDLFEFQVETSVVNKATSSMFELCVLQCLYERANQKSHELASEADLEKFRYK